VDRSMPNTGFSALIDPLGRIEGKTALFEPSVLPAAIHPRLPLKSPFLVISEVLFEEWFVRIAQLATLILMLALYRKKPLAQSN